MWTAEFWKAAAERAIKTAAQALLVLWMVGDVQFNALTIDLKLAAGIAAGGALASVLTSLVSAAVPVGPANSPSLVSTKDGV